MTDNQSRITCLITKIYLHVLFCSAKVITYCQTKLFHQLKYVTRYYSVCYANRRHQFTSLTLIFDLADVSRKAEFHWRARPCPWSLPTTRSSSRSHLLPTRIIGTCLTSAAAFLWYKLDAWQNLVGACTSIPPPWWMLMKQTRLLMMTHVHTVMSQIPGWLDWSSPNFYPVLTYHQHCNSPICCGMPV